MAQPCAITDVTKKQLERFNVNPPDGGWENLDRSYLQKTIRYLESLKEDAPFDMSAFVVSSESGWFLAKEKAKSDRDAIIRDAIIRDAIIEYAQNSDKERHVGVTQYTKLMRELSDSDLQFRLDQIQAENKRYNDLANEYPNITRKYAIRDVVSRLNDYLSAGVWANSTTWHDDILPYTVVGLPAGSLDRIPEGLRVKVQEVTNLEWLTRMTTKAKMRGARISVYIADKQKTTLLETASELLEKDPRLPLF